MVYNWNLGNHITLHFILFLSLIWKQKNSVLWDCNKWKDLDILNNKSKATLYREEAELHLCFQLLQMAIIAIWKGIMIYIKPICSYELWKRHDFLLFLSAYRNRTCITSPLLTTKLTQYHNSHGKYSGWNGSPVEISCWADFARPSAGIKNSPKNLWSHVIFLCFL